MPCYVETVQPPSKAEYELWCSMGYTGSYAEYAKSKKDSVGARFFICGDLGPHCSDCAGIGDFLCDYPVGDGKTCDRSMCGNHAHEIAPEIHYCDAHYRMWSEFRNAGGVDETLRNVIAFKAEK